MTVHTLARSDIDGFDIALRTRDGVTELIVNGVFAMDSSEVTSELALAELVPAQARRVLIGGLGLGFTANQLLASTHAQLTIVELSRALVDWARAGLTPQLHAVSSNRRVELEVGNVLEAFKLSDTYDAILLDVDNGPDFLIHENNATLYQPEILQQAVNCLRPGGLLAIWSERFSQGLADALAAFDGTVGHKAIPISRDGRNFIYAIHTFRSNS